jgi:hypothetical protein
MLRLRVKVFGTDVSKSCDLKLARLESDQFDADHVDALVQKCLEQAGEAGLPALKSTLPMVSVDLFADGKDAVRPGFHLSRETIRRLAEAGAEFDFDPYVYEQDRGSEDERDA